MRELRPISEGLTAGRPQPIGTQGGSLSFRFPSAATEGRRPTSGGLLQGLKTSPVVPGYLLAGQDSKEDINWMTCISIHFGYTPKKMDRNSSERQHAWQRALGLGLTDMLSIHLNVNSLRVEIFVCLAHHSNIC